MADIANQPAAARAAGRLPGSGYSLAVAYAPTQAYIRNLAGVVGREVALSPIVIDWRGTTPQGAASLGSALTLVPGRP